LSTPWIGTSLLRVGEDYDTAQGRPTIGPGTDPAYSTITISVPLGIAVTASLAAIMSIGSQLLRKKTTRL